MSDTIKLAICSREQVLTNLDSLYDYQAEITADLNSFAKVSVVGINGMNDYIWNQYYDDISSIALYVEDFIWSANDGYDDKMYYSERIQEYKGMCDGLSEPLKAAVLFLKMT